MTKKKEVTLLQKEMVLALEGISNVLETMGQAALVGLCAFIDYLLLGIDGVGTVIKVFNLFTTTLVDGIRLQNAGYKSVAEAEADKGISEELRRCAENIRGTWTTVFGVVRESKGVTYVTALAYDVVKERHNGFEYVKVVLDMARACFDRAANISGELPLDDVIQFSLDSEAIKRFFGEYTIDATKKPEDFLRDKPFFGYMQNVNQASSAVLNVYIKENRVIKEGCDLIAKDKNGNPTNALEVVKKESKTVEREDGRGALTRFFMTDIYQEIRSEAAEYLVELGELALKVPTQQLPKEEISAIAEVNRQYKKTVSPAVELLKQEWQSMANAIRRTRNEVERQFGKGSYAAEQHVKSAKRHNNACYDAVTNQLRIVFENAGIDDAVTRIRILLSAVMGNLQKVDWAKLSDFAHSALPEEWFIYVMTMMQGDVWTPSETMDKVSFTVELTDGQLAAINGRKVTFNDGMLAGKNGEIIAVADGVDLNGEFILRVADDGVYACHDIVSLVNVPKANRGMVIFATASDPQTIANVDHILETMMDKEVRLAPFCKDAIVVDGKAVGKFRCSLNGKTSKAINDMYGGANGVRGYVTEVVRGQYEEENGKVKKVAVVVLRNSTAPMLDDEVDGIGHLPELEVKEVKKPKLDRRAIGLKMSSAAEF